MSMTTNPMPRRTAPAARLQSPHAHPPSRARAGTTDNNPVPHRQAQRMRARRFGLLFGAVGAAALLAGGLPTLYAAAATVDAAAKTTSIKIANFAFSPADLTVSAGTTVTWKNEDGEVHRVQDDHNGFASAALDTHDSFSQTFAIPGVYHYFCSIHPYMVGKIVVKPAGK